MLNNPNIFFRVRIIYNREAAARLSDIRKCKTIQLIWSIKVFGIFWINQILKILFLLCFVYNRAAWQYSRRMHTSSLVLSYLHFVCNFSLNFDQTYQLNESIFFLDTDSNIFRRGAIKLKTEEKCGKIKEAR